MKPRVVPSGVLAGRRGPQGEPGEQGDQGIRGPAGYNATGAAEDQETIAAYIAAEAGANPVAEALADSFAARRSPLLGNKIVGGNIVPKPNGGSWGGMFSEWDWSRWIKPQVDRAIALGLDSIRCIGNPAIVFMEAGPSYPAISQDTYNNRWLQLADYCAEHGLKLYPCLNEKWAFYRPGTDDFDFTAAPRLAAIVSVAAALATRPNVIGFDVFQEESGKDDGLTLSRIIEVYAAIRAVAPKVPLTTSLSSGNFGTAADFWTDSAGLAAQLWARKDGADFVDLHVYITDPIPNDLSHYITTARKPLVIGEFGSSQDLPGPDQPRRFERIRRLHNLAGVSGSFVWALADQGTDSVNKVGVWDNTGFVQGSSALSITSGKRTALTDELARFSQSPLAESDRNLLPAEVRWVQTTEGWQEGENTNIDVGSVGLDMFPVGSGQFGAGIKDAYRFSIAPSTSYRFETEVLSSLAGRPLNAYIDQYDAFENYLTTSSIVTGTSATLTPARLVGVILTHSLAVSAKLVVTGTAAGTGERHTILRTPEPAVIAA